MNCQRKGKVQGFPFPGPESTIQGPGLTSSGMVFVFAIVLVVVEVVVEGLGLLQVTLQSKPRPWALPSVAHCTERRPRNNNGFFGLLDRQYLRLYVGGVKAHLLVWSPPVPGCVPAILWRVPPSPHLSTSPLLQALSALVWRKGHQMATRRQEGPI